MTIGRIKALLEADVLYGEDTLDDEVNYAFSSDMMSDVLAYADEHSALITGPLQSPCGEDGGDA